ncbi:MAG TPA: sigma-70 family RNA polymerase sigma factor [Nannocystis exedens]|nr:sigma-70 family RNA polymerase sigma factor [Nannocystis exedens]
MVVSPTVKDETLLHAWRSGDRDAGSELFARYFSALYRFFRNKVDRGVEDLVQRTFMAIVEGRERLRKDAAFRAYLYGAAHNILRGHYRRERALAREMDADELSIVDMGASPTSILAVRDEQRLLLEALRHLPLGDQTLLELYYWENLSGVELAAYLGVPENTARSRVRRARLRLESELARLSTSENHLRSTIDNLDRWAKSLRVDLQTPA